MKRILGGVAAVALVLGLSTNPAAAQIDNLAVYQSPAHGTGLTIAGDVGFGMNEDAKFDGESTPLAYGGRVILGLPVFQVSAGAAYVDPKIAGLDAEIAFGGNVALSVFNLPLVPVAMNVQAGVGYVTFGEGASQLKQLDVPIGVGIALKPMTPGVTVEPWVAPRVHIQRFELEGFGSNTEVGFGASGGLNITLPMGVGFHAAADFLSISDSSPLVVSVGAHYKLAIPSLGIGSGLLGG